jgi:hypothetical protein
MRRILMILTSHRLDCLRLCMDMLSAADSYRQFDRVVLLLNGVVGPHRQWIERYTRRRPEIAWDFIAGPRGRGERISSLQNECVRRYPESLYFKIDEDTFVCRGWVERLQTAYNAHRTDPDLALITPVIPNNSAGAFFLLGAFPDLAAEYRQRFPHPIDSDVNGPVATHPQIGEWITRKFLDLEVANRQLGTDNRQPFERFAYRFSINCIVYDYRHWQEIGGVPKQDEMGWGDWIPAHGKYVLLAADTMVHHYSFFVQQDWLDRTTLLEDLRRANLPGTMGFLSYHCPRWSRIFRQAPRALVRRLTRLNRRPG